MRVSVTLATATPLLPETDSVSTYDMNIYGRLGVFDGTSVDPAKELKTYRIRPTAASSWDQGFTVTSNSSHSTLDLYSGHFDILGPSSSVNQVQISMVATVEGS